MIGRVSSTPNKSLGDLELKQHDANKSKAKKSENPLTSASDPQENSEETLLAGPVNLRYLGKNLDLIA